MRNARWFAWFLVLAMAAPAGAQTVLLPPDASASKPAAAIIPGSPLAALTGAATPLDTGNDNFTPYGTDSIGMSFTSGMSNEAVKGIQDFAEAVRQSTRPAPIIDWLRTFFTLPVRQAALSAAGLGLLVALLPGLLVEAALRAGLARPKAALARQGEKLAPRMAEIEQGLADAEAGMVEKIPAHFDWRGLSLRLLLGLAYFCLSLVPILGFALTLEVMVSTGAVESRTGRLAVVGVVNAYLIYRLLREGLAFFIAPHAASLRLLPLDDQRADLLIRRALVIIGTAAVGFATVSTAEVLGLTLDGGAALMHFFALIVHVQVAIAIWQARHIVGGWIAGPPEASGPLTGVRQRLGQIWYIPTLFYVLAIWVAWAGGVHNAFGVLLRVVFVFVGAVVLGRLGWAGVSLLLARLFPAEPKDEKRTVFYARAQAYNPVLRGFARVIIGIFVLVIMLQGWGVDAIGWLAGNSLSRSLVGALISILITLAVAVAVWEFTNIMLNGQIERLTGAGKTRQASRWRTLLPMLKATVAVVIFLISGSICMAKIGVNVDSFLAIGGVLGIALGFGSQKLVQDIITGLFLLFEDAMQVGDVVSLAGMTGTVERLSIRTIRLRGDDGSVNIIPFSAVTTVTNMTRDFSIAQMSIQVAYDEDLQRVYAVLTDIAKGMRKEPVFGPMIREDLKIFGLDKFGATSLVITAQLRTGPGQHWAIRREFYGRVKTRFAAEGIPIPYDTQRLMIEPSVLNEFAAIGRGTSPADLPAPAGPPHGGAPA